MFGFHDKQDSTFCYHSQGPRIIGTDQLAIEKNLGAKQETSPFLRLSNVENELTQKPPNPLNSPKIGSAFVVSSIFLLGF
jgi:hypothetical protein